MQLFRVQTFNSILYLTYSKRAIANKGLRLYSEGHIARNALQNLHLKFDELNLKYNAVFNTGGNHYLILNRQLNVVDFNRASASLMHDVFSSSLTRGSFIGNYLNTDLQQSVLNNCYRALNGESFVFERQVKLQSGLLMWMQTEYAPIYNRQQQVDGVILNSVDVTERKLFEQKIELQNKKLRQISLMHSHDVRAPLCTLMGLVNLLKTEGKTNSDYLPLIDATIDLLDSRIKAVVDSASD